MKKILAYTLSFGMILGFSYNTATTAEAKTKIIHFQNCTAMHKIYKGGVAISSKTKNKGGKTHYKPFANKALYLANTKSDRDKDGIACEK